MLLATGLCNVVESCCASACDALSEVLWMCTRLWGYGGMRDHGHADAGYRDVGEDIGGQRMFVARFFFQDYEKSWYHVIHVLINLILNTIV